MTQSDYQTQLTNKVALLSDKLKPFGAPELDVFSSKPEHYRMRTEFRVWHDGDDLYYIMFCPETKKPYKVIDFPPASKLINAVMPILIEALKNNSILRHKLFQIDFLSTKSNECLISLLYHKVLDTHWETQINDVINHLSAQIGIKLNIIGRSKKQKIVIGNEFVIEELNVFDRVIRYQQVENSFTQPNASINEKMLEWCLTNTKNAQGDLLELYCGNGNFSLALAPNFDKVLATEISKSSVNSAQYNIKMNNIDNVKIVRLSAEEFTEALNGVREFRRLKQADIDLQHYDCQTILVDPPRAGLDNDTCQLISKYNTILYISCNPETLIRDLSILTRTHSIERCALFDQFPFTHHVESGILLSKNTGEL